MSSFLSRLRSKPSAQQATDQGPDLDTLKALFHKLGIPEPESWTQPSDAVIGQLHRYLFLRQMWAEIVDGGDDSWIEASIAEADRNPSGPYAGVGHGLRQLLDKNADRKVLTEIVRGMQAELLFRFCYLLDDPSCDEPELANIGWRLVETDADFQPTDRPICGLHELVLETDPTGREMRPREDAL